MIILLSPLIPQDENYLLWGPKQPEELFANGHLFNPDSDKSRLPKNPKVVHCSWTLNAEKKIEKYKNNNLWFMSDDYRPGLARARKKA